MAWTKKAIEQVLREWSMLPTYNVGLVNKLLALAPQQLSQASGVAMLAATLPQVLG